MKRRFQFSRNSHYNMIFFFFNIDDDFYRNDNLTKKSFQGGTCSALDYSSIVFSQITAAVTMQILDHVKYHIGIVQEEVRDKVCLDPQIFHQTKNLPISTAFELTLTLFVRSSAYFAGGRSFKHSQVMSSLFILSPVCTVVEI